MLFGLEYSNITLCYGLRMVPDAAFQVLKRCIFSYVWWATCSPRKNWRWQIWDTISKNILNRMKVYIPDRLRTTQRGMNSSKGRSGWRRELEIVLPNDRASCLNKVRLLSLDDLSGIICLMGSLGYLCLKALVGLLGSTLRVWSKVRRQGIEQRGMLFIY